MASAGLMNCTGVDFAVSDLNDVYRRAPGSDAWWKGDGGKFLFWEPITKCWVVSDFPLSDNLPVDPRDYSWPAVHKLTCGSDRAIMSPPESVWRHRGADGQELSQFGKIICRGKWHDSWGEYAPDDQGRSMPDRRELSMVLILTVAFWVFLTGCRMYQARMRIRRLRRRGLVGGNLGMSAGDDDMPAYPVRPIGSSWRRQVTSTRMGSVEETSNAVATLTQSKTGSLYVTYGGRGGGRRVKLIRWKTAGEGEGGGEGEDGGGEVGGDVGGDDREDGSKTSAKEGEEEDCCCVCLSAAPDVTIAPCKHRLQCLTCIMRQLLNWTHPEDPYCCVCRTKIDSLILHHSGPEAGSAAINRGSFFGNRAPATLDAEVVFEHGPHTTVVLPDDRYMPQGESGGRANPLTSTLNVLTAFVNISESVRQGNREVEEEVQSSRLNRDVGRSVRDSLGDTERSQEEIRLASAVDLASAGDGAPPRHPSGVSGPPAAFEASHRSSVASEGGAIRDASGPPSDSLDGWPIIPGRDEGMVAEAEAVFEGVGIGAGRGGGEGQEAGDWEPSMQPISVSQPIVVQPVSASRRVSL